MIGTNAIGSQAIGMSEDVGIFSYVGSVVSQRLPFIRQRILSLGRITSEMQDDSDNWATFYGKAPDVSARSFSVVKGYTGQVVDVFVPSMTTIFDWVCSMTLVSSDGTMVIERPVVETNLDGTHFVAYLSSQETSNIDVDLYKWTVSLSHLNYSASQTYVVSVEPAAHGAYIQPIQKGVNSFGTYEEMITQVSFMPMLGAVHGSDRTSLRSALSQAWQNIGRVTVDFDNGLSSTEDFDISVISALTSSQRLQLIQAQIIEADFLLGGNPIEMRRRMGLMSDSSGESAHFMRPTKPVVLPICRDAAHALSPYVRYSAIISR